jgi:hypothetical protein
VSDAGSNSCSMSALASKRQLSRGHSGKATIRPGDESVIELSLRSHPWLGLQGWTCVCFAFVISHMTIIQASTSLALSLIIPLISAAGRISIVPRNRTPGDWEMIRMACFRSSSLTCFRLARLEIAQTDVHHKDLPSHAES